MIQQGVQPFTFKSSPRQGGKAKQPLKQDSSVNKNQQNLISVKFRPFLAPQTIIIMHNCSKFF